MTVNNLRKSSNDEEMITVAKTLIKTWKKFVPENDTKKPVKEDTREREEKKAEKQSKSAHSSRPSFSGDEMRSRCRDLLLSGILIVSSEVVEVNLVVVLNLQAYLATKAPEENTHSDSVGLSLARANQRDEVE